VAGGNGLLVSCVGCGGRRLVPRGWGGGSQTYLWPSGTGVGVPGDMMIDRVTLRPAGVRPLSLTRVRLR
jgi:hypothetical protein